MGDLLHASKCESVQHCVFTMKPLNLSSGKDLGPINVFYPSNLSEAVGLQDPRLKVKTVLTVNFYSEREIQSIRLRLYLSPLL